MSTPLFGETMAPVLAHTLLASGVITYCMNAFAPSLSFSAPTTSPPKVVTSSPPKLGNGYQSIVSPIFRSLFVWPVAMPPTKPPS